MPNLDARIVEFLLNALWQLPLLGMLAAVTDRLLLSRCRPEHRYRFWLSVTLLAAALPWLPRWHGPAVPLYQMRLAVTADASASAGAAPLIVPWWTVAFAVYLLAVWTRLAVRCLRLRRLAEHNTQVPLTYGSRVILPSAFVEQASPLAVRAARAHEEAHVARRDFAWNVACEVMASPVAWHPAMWWMRRRLSNVREMACDETAARHFAQPAEYAQGLVEAAVALTHRRQAALSLGLFDAFSFEERIDMLIESRPWLSSRAARVATAAAFTLLLAGGTAARLLAVAVEDSAADARKDDGVTRPRLIHKLEPTYTDAARDAKISGTVVLSLVVNTVGTAESIHVERGLDAGLDQAAIDAVSQWQFEPARKNGEPIATKATVEVNFRLKNDELSEPAADGKVGPRILSKKPPLYPAEAKRDRVQGRVELQLVINAEGVPEQIRVSRRVDPRLDQAALDAVSQWRWEPAQKDGQAVAVSTSLDVNFTLLP